MTRSRKALLLTLVAFAISCLLYLWLPYRVAVVQFFFWLGGSRLLIPAEYAALDAPKYVPVERVPQYHSSVTASGRWGSSSAVWSESP